MFFDCYFLSTVFTVYFLSLYYFEVVFVNSFRFFCECVCLSVCVLVFSLCVSAFTLNETKQMTGSNGSRQQ